MCGLSERFKYVCFEAVFCLKNKEERKKKLTKTPRKHPKQMNKKAQDAKRQITSGINSFKVMRKMPIYTRGGSGPQDLTYSKIIWKLFLLMCFSGIC